jgi:hypothetical protein
LGSGAPIEENDCSEDFFQQAISSIPNIGCYGGEGVEGEYKDDSLWQKIVEWFTNVFYLIRNFIISV